MAKRKAKRKAKRELGTHAHAATGPSLLDLPAEVRIMIYRLLLVADETLGGVIGGPVWANFGEFHLHPAILGVCRQIYQEGSPILNGENTFGIRIYGWKRGKLYDCWNVEQVDIIEDEKFPSEAGTELMNSYFNLEEGSFWNCNASLDRFKRLEILINRAYLAAVKLHISALCSLILRTMPALQHLTLHLLEPLCNFQESTLEPFAMLRNLRSVRLCGIPQWYKDRGVKGLTDLMLGNSPSENLMEMYSSLERYVHLHGDPLLLGGALMAVKEWDVKRFKKERSKLLSDIQRKMDRALSLVFVHDAEIEGTTIRPELRMSKRP